MYMRFSESRQKKVHVGGFTKIRSDAGIFISFGSIENFILNGPSVQVFNFGTKNQSVRNIYKEKEY